MFDRDQNSSTAVKEWIHWFRTFTNFLESIESQAPNKLKILTNYVDHSNFDYISDCTDYETAVETLKNLDVKSKKEIFARHLLTSRKQKSGETLDQFLQSLKIMAKDCNYKAVTKAVNMEEAVRDAFINGLQSHSIHQRLLENATLDLQAAFTRASSLDKAQKNSETYSVMGALSQADFSATSSVTVDHFQQQQQPQQQQSQLQQQHQHQQHIAATNNQKCYFCGECKA